jgi:hypothetical protein
MFRQHFCEISQHISGYSFCAEQIIFGTFLPNAVAIKSDIVQKLLCFWRQKCGGN